MGGRRGARPNRRRAVLALDLSRPVADGPTGSPLARLLTARRPQLRQIADTVMHAAEDRRVRVLLARVDHPAESWAHAEELRDVIARFRASGKPAIAHAQSFGEFSDGTLAFAVAVGFDEIHLQPTGEVGLVGAAAEVPFLADLLGKLDIVAEVDRRHEYKSAAELLTERGFSEAYREAADRVVASRHEQLVRAIAAGRGLTETAAAEAVDAGPLAAAEAQQRGLVDRLSYRDQTAALAKEMAGDGARLVGLASYRPPRARRWPWTGRRPTVALIHGRGAIQVGRGRRSPLGHVMGSDTVALGFAQAIRDRRVRAVLFRVDSPGGSAVASDAIWRAVMRAREAGKPVVVSMGAVAGSGGYWVATAADRIVAQPGTLTGSIGVVIGKLVTRGLAERLGVTSDETHRGANALMFSRNHRFTESQWERAGAFLDRVYEGFIDRVAEGRGMPRDAVGDIARGRVWTGADALERGLVDELGGYLESFDALRRLLGLAPGAPLRVRALPRLPLAQRLGLRRADLEEAGALLGSAGDGLRAVGLSADGAARMPDWVQSVRWSAGRTGLRR